MVFSSHLFVFYFLPAALLFYALSPRRLKNLTLTAASFVFYGWTNPIYILLLVASTLIDYTCGLVLVSREAGGWREKPLRPGADLPLLVRKGPRTRRQVVAFTVSMCANLALLGFFKYFNFTVDSWNGLVGVVGLTDLRLEGLLRVVLPLGISFYTFQSMSYAIDVYRGDARAMRNVIDFFCFESMFPQLVAGPIIRFSEVADQLERRTHTLDKFARGVAFFALGLAKKILIANPCGKVADAAFDAGSLLIDQAWWGLLAYAFQIYYDFSAYSDMAVGLGLLMGFVFAKNFDSPYRAESLTEFWRRWHISLSTWLRDYLYVPLGGSRKGPRRTYVNLLVTMLLGGLWHGASWNFVLWGGFHGALLAAERANGGRSLYGFLPRPLRVAATFALVLLSWVPFRARDLGAAIHYLATLAGLTSAQPAAGLVDGIVYRPYYVLTLAVAALVVWTCPQTWTWTRDLGWKKAALAACVLLASLAVMTTQAYNPFIYFIF